MKLGAHKFFLDYVYTTTLPIKEVLLVRTKMAYMQNIHWSSEYTTNALVQVLSIPCSQLPCALEWLSFLTYFQTKAKHSLQQYIDVNALKPCKIQVHPIHNNFHVETTYISRDNEWIKKMWPIYTMEYSVQFSSVAQSCLTLCDPMDCIMPGLTVHHQLPEFTQTHVHWVGDAIQPPHPLSSLSPPAFNLSQH